MRLGRWRGSAVDPGAELERVVDALPRLRRLTLPVEWALGWPPPGLAGRPPDGAASEDPAAAPLARLLLRCAGRAGAPAITVTLPPEPLRKFGPDLCTPCVISAGERIERVCTAAARVAAAGGAEDGGAGCPPPGGAPLLPHVTWVACERGDPGWDGPDED
jgi:hypothetical protein